MAHIILHDRKFTFTTTEAGANKPNRLVINSVRKYKEKKMYRDGKILKTGPRRYMEVSYEFNIDITKTGTTYTYWSHEKTEIIPRDKLTRKAFIDLIKAEYNLCKAEYTPGAQDTTPTIVID